MRLVQRVIAGIASVLLLQLSLMGPDALCVSNRGAAGHRPHGGAASSSDHHVTVMSGMSHQSADATASEPCDQNTDDACPGPAGRSACGSMILCSVALSEPAAREAMVAAALSADDPREPLALTADFTIAPELPPPRA